MVTVSTNVKQIEELKKHTALVAGIDSSTPRYFSLLTYKMRAMPRKDCGGKHTHLCIVCFARRSSCRAHVQSKGLLLSSAAF